MNEPTYKQQFQKAIARSDEMGCSSANDFEPQIRPGTQVSGYLSVTEQFMENVRPPPPHACIRCAVKFTLSFGKHCRVVDYRASLPSAT